MPEWRIGVARSKDRKSPTGEIFAARFFFHQILLRPYTLKVKMHCTTTLLQKSGKCLCTGPVGCDWRGSCPSPPPQRLHLLQPSKATVFELVELILLLALQIGVICERTPAKTHVGAHCGSHVFARVIVIFTTRTAHAAIGIVSTSEHEGDSKG